MGGRLSRAHKVLILFEYKGVTTEPLSHFMHEQSLALSLTDYG